MNWFENYRYKRKTRNGDLIIFLIRRLIKGNEFTLFEFTTTSPSWEAYKEIKGKKELEIRVPDRPDEQLTVGVETKNMTFEQLLTQRLRDLSHKVIIYSWGDSTTYSNLALMDARWTTEDGRRKIRFYQTK